MGPRGEAREPVVRRGDPPAGPPSATSPPGPGSPSRWFPWSCGSPERQPSRRRAVLDAMDELGLPAQQAGPRAVHAPHRHRRRAAERPPQPLVCRTAGGADRLAARGRRFAGPGGFLHGPQGGPAVRGGPAGTAHRRARGRGHHHGIRRASKPLRPPCPSSWPEPAILPCRGSTSSSTTTKPARARPPSTCWPSATGASRICRVRVRSGGSAGRATNTRWPPPGSNPGWCRAA